LGDETGRRARRRAEKTGTEPEGLGECEWRDTCVQNWESVNGGTRVFRRAPPRDSNIADAAKSSAPGTSSGQKIGLRSYKQNTNLSRGSRCAAVGQPCGACAPPRLLDRRLALWRRGRRYSNFALPIKSARPLFLSRRNLACCFFFIGVCNFQAAYSVFLYYRRVVQVLRGGQCVCILVTCAYSRTYHWLRVEKERKHVSVMSTSSE